MISLRSALDRERGARESALGQAGGVAAAARENEVMGAALARREENIDEEVRPIVHDVLGPILLRVLDE